MEKETGAFNGLVLREIVGLESPKGQGGYGMSESCFESERESMVQIKQAYYF
jgi:hypothetical protein